MRRKYVKLAVESGKNLSLTCESVVGEGKC